MFSSPVSDTTPADPPMDGATMEAARQCAKDDECCFTVDGEAPVRRINDVVEVQAWVEIDPGDLHEAKTQADPTHEPRSSMLSAAEDLAQALIRADRSAEAWKLRGLIAECSSRWRCPSRIFDLTYECEKNKAAHKDGQALGRALVSESGTLTAADYEAIRAAPTTTADAKVLLTRPM